MKILRLLNSKYLSIIFIFFLLNCNTFAEDEPVDIWNIDKKNINKTSTDQTTLSDEESEDVIKDNNIYESQSLKELDSVEVDNTLKSKEVEIIGLYDPEDFDLEINVWTNSDGDQLKYLFTNLKKLDLSKDAADLMNIVLLTNAYYPNFNITKNEFLEIKSDWLIRDNNLELIEEYLIKNQTLNLHPKLSRHLIDQYLSDFNLKKACEIFSKNDKPINDIYLSKFNIYCLLNDGKNEEAQLIFDLKKELGFQDNYFEKKLNFLFGYENKVDKSISEKNILDFHLAHRTDPEFFYEPKENTNKLIWRYLAASNLLYNIKDIEITELDKISLIEKAVHDKNYSENDLFEIYKRFQFSINQFLNATDAFKALSSIEARALIYQRILLESDARKKLELIEILKNLFVKDNLSNAFDDKLIDLLSELNPEEIPSNFNTFYNNYLKNDEDNEKKTKFNNDVLHQSKLVNYFNGDFAKSKIEKDINNFLKKIKKDKKYNLSKKDIILIESLRSDGIEISKKYDNLYELNESEMPTDIQVMINNKEMGAVILRIVEVIGEDKLESLDEDTLYFIISALNQLDIDHMRNKILLKVLPLKV